MRRKAVSLLMAAVMVLTMLTVSTGTPVLAAGGVTPKTNPTKNPQAAEDLAEFFADVPAVITTEDGSTTSTKCWHIGTASDGGSVAVSGNKGKSSSTSTMVMTFTSDAEVTFDYYVSTEAKWDKVKIVQSGSASKTLVNDESGDNGWKTLTGVSVKKGDKLTFTYTKDSSGDKNDDCFAVRNMTAGEAIVVTFHANGGTGDDYTQNYYGTSAKALAANTFTKDHGAFLGWATAADGEVVYTDGQEIAPEANMDLYAVWESAYEVTFNFNDNGATPDKVLNIPENTAIGEANIPTASRTGYKVGGWYDGETAIDGTTVITEDKTFTAQWTPINYTVHFAANGGEGEAADFTATYDEDITFPEAGTFTRKGWHQTGWGTSTSYASYAMDASVKNLKSNDGDEITLNAIWTGNGLNLTADLNYEGSTPVQRRAQVGQNYNYIYDDETGRASFSSLADPVREGYNFKGWFTEAEGGTEIGTSYKFEDDDDFTMYAHWAEAITITFDAATNGGKCSTNPRKIDKGTAVGSLPGSYSVTTPSDKPKLIGWFTEAEGGEEVTSATIFEEDATIYAKFRDYYQTITFNANGGEGTMEQFRVFRNVPTILPENTFTREGYVFDQWVSTLSSWSTPKYYADGGEYTWSTSYAYNDSTQTLYATWKEDIFGYAWKAIDPVMAAHTQEKETGGFDAPVSGTGATTTTWSATYESSNTEYVTVDAAGKVTVAALPQTGTETVTITVTVKNDSTGETQQKTYDIVLLSEEAAEAEDYLKKAVAMLAAFEPVYGTDTNANDTLASTLSGLGYPDITVEVTEAAQDAAGTASIDADGTIHYYFDPENFNNQYDAGKHCTPFDTGFKFTYNGVSVEKSLSTTLTWDKEQVREYLQDTLDRMLGALPTEPVSELTLDRYPVKEGVDRTNIDYNQYTNFDLWGNAQWTSGNADRLIIEAAPDYPPYSPYAVTLVPTYDEIEVDLDVSLNIPLNDALSDIVVTGSGSVTIASNGIDPLDEIREDFENRLDYALEFVGLRDYTTGELIDTGNVTEDIAMPKTSDFKDENGYGLDGKYQPVTITTDNPQVIDYPRRLEDPSQPLNNAARVYVYRPMPGEDPQEVNITITITDKATGVAVSRDIPVTVQPLTEAEIDAELEKMEAVKLNYFEGIRFLNDDGPKNITLDLQSFVEANVEEDGSITWVRNALQMTNDGIVPVAMDGWEVEEQWRLFRSSRPDVISHEILAVTRQLASVPVTITSWLSSEKYGKYAERVAEDAEYAALYADSPLMAKLEKLYNQEVTADLVVLGTDPSVEPEKDRTVTVTIRDHADIWVDAYEAVMPAGSNAYQTLAKAAKEENITLTGATYVSALTREGEALKEKDRGENSGWEFLINGTKPEAEMDGEWISLSLTQYYVEDGDDMVFYYTDDYLFDDDSKEDPGHEHDRTVQYDETSHWYFCPVCGYEDAAKEEHVFGEWEEITAADCESAGTSRHECECGYAEEKTVEALGHDWGTGVVEEEPLCESAGVIVYTCQNDPTHVKRVALTENGHTWETEYTEDVPAGCGVEGTESIHCSVCGAIQPGSEQTIPALEHEWGEWTVTADAACETAGEEQRVCANDASHVETRSIEALGHRWGEWFVAAEPDCTDPGERQQVCANDPEHINRQSIPALGHDLQAVSGFEPGCETEGERDHWVCTVCSLLFADQAGKKEITEAALAVPALGHAWGKWQTTVEPTCTEDGEEQRVCANDRSHTETRTADALGHSWDKGTVVKEATYFKTGTMRYTCKRCSETKTEVIPKLPRYELKDVKLNHPNKKYIGKALTQNLSMVVTADVEGKEVKLTRWVDYKVAYKNNTNVGTATITITGKGGYYGTIVKTFQITPVKIENVEADLTAATYTGKAIKKDDSIKVTATVGEAVKTLKKGTDYTVKYEDNKNVGTAKIIITGKGNFKGTITKKFRINPAGISLKSLTAGTKSLTAVWPGKAAGAQLSQMQYSTKKDFSSADTKTIVRELEGKELTKTVNNLPSGKTYYVRVRTVTKTGGKNYYSDWSAVKSVKVK